MISLPKRHSGRSISGSLNCSESCVLCGRDAVLDGTSPIDKIILQIRTSSLHLPVSDALFVFDFTYGPPGPLPVLQVCLLYPSRRLKPLCMTVLYSRKGNKPLFVYKDGNLVQCKLKRMRSETWKVSSVIQKTLTQHCSSGSFAQKFFHLDHFVQNLEKDGTLSLPHSGLFKQFNVPLKESVRMTLGGFGRECMRP